MRGSNSTTCVVVSTKRSMWLSWLVWIKPNQLNHIDLLVETTTQVRKRLPWFLFRFQFQ